MELYRFYIDAGKLQKELLDVEEKPKTYTIAGCDWRKRIAKEDIEAVDCQGRVHLLENDTKKAIGILKEHCTHQKAKHDEYHERMVEDFSRAMKALDAAEKEATNE